MILHWKRLASENKQANKNPTDQSTKKTQKSLTLWIVAGVLF